MFTSPDGINWMLRDVGRTVSGLAYGKGMFVAAAGASILQSGVFVPAGDGPPSRSESLRFRE